MDRAGGRGVEGWGRGGWANLAGVNARGLYVL